MYMPCLGSRCKNRQFVDAVVQAVMAMTKSTLRKTQSLPTDGTVHPWVISQRLATLTYPEWFPG